MQSCDKVLIHFCAGSVSMVVGTFGVYATGVVLDLSHQDWSIVWYMNAAVNVLGALAFIGLYDSKREFD